MIGLSKRRTLGPCLFVIALALTGVAAVGGGKAHAQTAPAFGSPINLPTSTGWEPSIAIDYNSCSAGFNCDMYIVSQASEFVDMPTEWHSYDSGATWANPVPFDTQALQHNFDTDVAVQPGNGNVIVTAMDNVPNPGVPTNATYAFVQVSTDHGKTFNTGFRTAPGVDRPWLTASGSSTVYVAYHDFNAGVPVVCTSQDGGTTFPSCVQALIPTAASDCAGNNRPARFFVADPTDSSLNFVYSCSTLAENLAAGYEHDYFLARSTNGGLVYNSTTPVFRADIAGGKTPNFANAFGNFAADAAGNYYAMFSGTHDENHVLSNPFHVYYVWSPDKGTTWYGPYRVDTDQAGTHQLAHFAVTGTGNIDAVWYADPLHTGEPNGTCITNGTIATFSACTDNSTTPVTPVGMDGRSGTTCPAISATDTRDSCPVLGNWKVYMTQTTNANTIGGGTFSTPVPVDPNYRHFGTMCGNGILCGGAADRSLGDFISVAVDCAGAAHVTYAADKNTPTAHTTAHAFSDGPWETDVVNQTGGTTITPPSGCASPGTNVPDLPLAATAPLGGLLGVGAFAYVRRRWVKVDRDDDHAAVHG